MLRYRATFRFGFPNAPGSHLRTVYFRHFPADVLILRVSAWDALDRNNGDSGNQDVTLTALEEVQ